MVPGSARPAAAGRPRWEIASVATQERDEALARLYTAEMTLVWLRRIAMAGWGGVLLWKHVGFGWNTPWAIYLASVAYTEILHWHLRRRWRLGLLTWVSALGDAILVYLMCVDLGKSTSLLVPFFYFSILAAAFRFGGRRATFIVVANTLLFIILFLQEEPATRDEKNLVFVLLYIGYSYVFGVMLADWATSNLRRALVKSQELEQERDRSQELLHVLINTQEEERKKLAGDLHDRMGEKFFSISHTLDECMQQVSDAQVRDRLETSRALVLSCASYVRVFMNELRPTVLDELGPSEAISEYVAQMRETVPFSITTQLDPALRVWRSKEDAMLFRLVQEALLNIRKHAHAKAVCIALRQDGARIQLVIEDDGRGFEVARVPVGHFGLMTMRERAEVSGGCFDIDSRAGRGTRIRVTFPNDSCW